MDAFRVVHIIPVADECGHDEDESCWCAPSVEVVEGTDARIVVHNAADMREEYERATGEALRGKPWLCVADSVPIENDPYE